MKTRHREQCVQTKSDERCESDDNNNEQIPDHTDTDEDDDSEQESDNDARFGFQRIVPDEFPLNSEHVSEANKRSNDDAAADEQCERVFSNCIQHKPKRKRLHTKKELNLNDNDETHMRKHLWIVDMKMILDHVTEVSG